MKKHLFPLLIILACCVSCSKPASTMSDEQREQIRVPLVKTVDVTLVPDVEYFTISGIAKEGRTIKQSFRVAGPLVEYNAQVGKRVKQGALLARIDDRDYILANQQVEAELAKANATYSAMKTGARPEDLAAAQANYNAMSSQFEIAQANETRFAALLESQAVPQIKYDEIKLKRDQAQAAKEAAEQTLKKAQTGSRKEEIEAMEAAISALKVVQQKAKNALADTYLYAPSDGYVSQKYVEKGEIVAPGIPVFAFTDVSKILVQATIPENLLLQRDNIVSYTCIFSALGNASFTASVHELGIAMQAGKQGYPLELVLEDAQQVLPGMVADIQIGIKNPRKGFVVPAGALSAMPGAVTTSEEKKADEKNAAASVTEAVQHAVTQTDTEDIPYTGKSDASCVWVVSADNTVTPIPVKIVKFTADGVEITGELPPKCKIVAAGARFLTQGQKVRLK